MSEKGQFGEPWVRRSSNGRDCVAVFTSGDDYERDRVIIVGNSWPSLGAAERGMECLNALDGMNPEALGEFLDAALKFRNAAGFALFVPVPALDKFDSAWKALKGEGDE